MEYKIIRRVSREYSIYGKMEEEVAEAITEGWKPLGGISVSEAGSYFTLGQAMVKE